MKKSLKIITVLHALLLTATPAFFSTVEAAVSRQGLERAGKEITELIVLFTVIVATIGIVMGAIKIRKGLQSEGKDTIVGSLVCLFIASSLYMIIALVSG